MRPQDKLLIEKLKEENIDHEYFDGSFNTTKRQDAINRFQQDENCRVFVISLKAGGMGLNLTEADYVYIMDPWWNPAVEDQAIARALRIGQLNKVHIFRFITRGTINKPK